MGFLCLGRDRRRMVLVVGWWQCPVSPSPGCAQSDQLA